MLRSVEGPSDSGRICPFIALTMLFFCWYRCAAVWPRNHEQEQIHPETASLRWPVLSRPCPVRALRPQQHLLHLPVQSVRLGIAWKQIQQHPMYICTWMSSCLLYLLMCVAGWSTCQLSENAICGQGSRLRAMDCVRSDGKIVELQKCEQVKPFWIKSSEFLKKDGICALQSFFFPSSHWPIYSILSAQLPYRKWRWREHIPVCHWGAASF